MRYVRRLCIADAVNDNKEAVFRNKLQLRHMNSVLARGGISVTALFIESFP